MEKLAILRAEVQKLYEPRNPSADEWTDWAYKNHVLVVADLAEKIAKTQNADVDFAVAGALLHDIADAIMDRDTPGHEAESLKIATDLLQKSGFSTKDTEFIVREIIAPHSCNPTQPTALEGRVMATADGAAHFLTDFYSYFCWQHYGPRDDYQVFKDWVLHKMEKDFTKKLFFDDIKQAVLPKYEALKLVFG